MIFGESQYHWDYANLNLNLNINLESPAPHNVNLNFSVKITSSRSQSHFQSHVFFDLQSQCHTISNPYNLNCKSISICVRCFRISISLLSIGNSQPRNLNIISISKRPMLGESRNTWDYGLGWVSNFGDYFGVIYFRVSIFKFLFLAEVEIG